MAPRRRPRRRRLGLVLALALAAVASVELVLHLKPTALPAWYREQFPVMGVEFVQPGILSQTPIEGYPVPGPQRSYAGPPPAGLIAPTPLVDPAANPDPLRYPRVVMPIDAKGFPNERIPERADILFVGDSFTFATGGTDPACLQPLLADSGGWSIYNLGIPGIGPIRERWLMETQGLPLQPKAVVWFFFGGNDFSDVEKTQARLDTGAKVYTDNPAYEAVPNFLLADFLMRWFDTLGAEERVRPRMTYGARLGRGPDADVDVWFSPLYVRLMLTDRPGWKRRTGWELFSRELKAAKAALDERGIPMLLVYVPTKVEALLPVLLENAAAQGALAPGDAQDGASSSSPLDPLWDMVTLNLKEESPISKQEFFDAIQLNIGVLDTQVSNLCRQNKIAYFSATAPLRQLASQGRLPYLSADTHWNDRGQAALVEPLREALIELGLEAR